MNIHEIDANLERFNNEIRAWQKEIAADRLCIKTVRARIAELKRQKKKEKK